MLIEYPSSAAYTVQALNYLLNKEMSDSMGSYEAIIILLTQIPAEIKKISLEDRNKDEGWGQKERPRRAWPA